MLSSPRRRPTQRALRQIPRSQGRLRSSFSAILTRATMHQQDTTAWPRRQTIKIINILMSFGAIAVAAGILALNPTFATGAAIGVAVVLIGLGVSFGAREQRSCLGTAGPVVRGCCRAALSACSRRLRRARVERDRLARACGNHPQQLPDGPRAARAWARSAAAPGIFTHLHADRDGTDDHDRS